MRAFRFAAGTTGLIAMLAAGTSTASAGPSAWVPTHTQGLSEIVSAPTTKNLGSLAGSTPMRIDVVLPVRRQSALAARATAEAKIGRAHV